MQLSADFDNNQSNSIELLCFYHLIAKLKLCAYVCVCMYIYIYIYIINSRICQPDGAKSNEYGGCSKVANPNEVIVFLLLMLVCSWTLSCRRTLLIGKLGLTSESSPQPHESGWLFGFYGISTIPWKWV